MSVSSSKKITPILSAELGKLVTLPWIWFTLTGAFIINLVLAVAFTSIGQQGAAGTQRMVDTGLASMGYLQAGFIILGILTTCSEYTGGQIRTTLTVTPWRGFQLSAKHLALAIIAIPAAFIMVASGVLYAFVMTRDTKVIEMNTLIKTLVGATGYLTMTSLLSAAIGALIRRTTPVLIILLGYYFVVSPLARNYLPGIKHVFPDTAGYYMYRSLSSDEMNVLTPMQGTGISMLWTLIFIIFSVVLYRKRDA